MNISFNVPSAGPTVEKAGAAAQDITAADILGLESFRGISEGQAAKMAEALKTFAQVVFMACAGRQTA